MTSRPIIFSALAGKVNTGEKDVTRRPIIYGDRDRIGDKPERTPMPSSAQYDGLLEGTLLHQFYLPVPHMGVGVKCPYGAPGDELWVREAHCLWGKWEAFGLTKTGRQRWEFVAITRGQYFRKACYADEPPLYVSGSRREDVGWHKRNPRFMSRWASRTTLIVKDVRAERLQDITEEDAKREGFDSPPSVQSCSIHTAASTLYPIPLETSSRAGFMEYWDAMYAKKPELQWGKNPWVWRIEFERKE